MQINYNFNLESVFIGLWNVMTRWREMEIRLELQTWFSFLSEMQIPVRGEKCRNF